ncbi:MAG TPA: PKD domain-containing protein [Chitinophagaceae bacterium]|jgi:gliding motility-associated-like protein|nr:PKD domain-containing protein [Chitinophagaceae bacterium]
MKKLIIYFFLLLLVTSAANISFSQYILNGSAEKIRCNCYNLTNAIDFQSGSVWNSNKINLNNSFDFRFNVYLGCKDGNGADGIVFILQPISTSVGTYGEGLGFEGVSPSVGISLDTWQNFNRNDPAYDHISIQLNGIITHGNDLAGPIQASATSDNIEDCAWHVFRITWDASTKTLSTYFDGQFRLQAQYDFIKNVFNNDPMVYWGFSAATGGANNLQQFCTALNPVFTTNLPNNSTCIGNPVIFIDQSESFTVIQSFYWDFGDGTTSTLQNPPVHNYALPGAYTVKHVIKGMDGCVSDTMKKIINIGTKPVADFKVFDTCSNKTFLGVTDQSISGHGAISQWAWSLDGSVTSTTQQPQFSNLLLGSHQLKLAVTSTYGCMSDIATKNFFVWPAPIVAIEAENGCINALIKFSGQQIDNATTIARWNWKFGDGLVTSQQSPNHTYSSGGNKIVHLTGTADNGCSSNDTTYKIHVDDIYTNAGKDTSVQQNKPFKLKGSWGGDVVGRPTLEWSPPNGLSAVNDSTPIAILQNDQVYYLTAVTDAGCRATDNIKITVFKFPGVLVPTAFTPNHDGLNEVLKPRYNGIKRLDYFAVYNRWGELLFKTSDMDAGWDGNFRGQPQAPGTFVWIVSAEDFNGTKYQLKGTATIIK